MLVYYSLFLLVAPHLRKYIGRLVRVVSIHEAFILFELEIVLFLLALFHLPPSHIGIHLIHDILNLPHLLQSIDCTHLLLVGLVESLDVLPVHDILLLTLVNELQFFELFLGESEHVFPEVCLFDGAFLLLLMIFLTHFFNNAIVLLLFLWTYPIYHLRCAYLPTKLAHRVVFVL